MSDETTSLNVAIFWSKYLYEYDVVMKEEREKKRLERKKNDVDNVVIFSLPAKKYCT